MCYAPVEEPKIPNTYHVKWPITTIEEIVVGIDNTIKNDYEIAKKIN
jgi:hypothetical protein